MLVIASGGQLRTQISRFVVVGLTSTALDALVYHATALLLPVPSAKAFGYLVGMSFSIACNRSWSFSVASGSRALVACILIYVAALGMNVLSNSLAIVVTHSTPLAFCVATGVSAVCTFLGMRWLAGRT
jgi:putative flippase GtrA